jgi:molybdate transport system substrate-binding protein
VSGAGRTAAAIGVLLLAPSAARTGSPSPSQAREPLRVFAAASLTEVIEAVAGLFQGARVEASLGSSSALARQIRDGAPADVFLSASADWIGFLGEAEALAGPALVFARNRLVCIAPRGSPLASRGGRLPGDLSRLVGAAGRVAIADEGVPAGEYARSALRQLGLLSALEGRLVGQRDVRAVLHAVEQGEVDAGFVYATDARIAAVEVLFAFDPGTHPAIEYHAAVLRGAADPAVAREFVAQLRGEALRSRLAAAGFALP